MMNAKYFWTLAIITFLFSCIQEQEKGNEFNKQAVITEINKMFDNYHNDIKSTGLTSEFKYLDNSDDFFWVPPGQNCALSYDSVKAILEKNAVAFRKIEFHWDTLQIFPLSAQIATYSGIVSGTMIDTSGVKSSVQIIESGTVIKRKDGWKLLSGQSATLTTN